MIILHKKLKDELFYTIEYSTICLVFLTKIENFCWAAWLSRIRNITVFTCLFLSSFPQKTFILLCLFEISNSNFSDNFQVFCSHATNYLVTDVFLHQTLTSEIFSKHIEITSQLIYEQKKKNDNVNFIWEEVDFSTELTPSWYKKGAFVIFILFIDGGSWSPGQLTCPELHCHWGKLDS